MVCLGEHPATRAREVLEALASSREAQKVAEAALAGWRLVRYDGHPAFLVLGSDYLRLEATNLVDIHIELSDEAGQEVSCIGVASDLLGLLAREYRIEDRLFGKARRETSRVAVQNQLRSRTPTGLTRVRGVGCYPRLMRDHGGDLPESIQPAQLVLPRIYPRAKTIESLQLSTVTVSAQLLR
jgi:hypothetical protein